MNYFQFICFLWAFIGIGSRLMMLIYRKKWNAWELNHAYSINKPKWIYIIACLSICLVAYTWYQLFITQIPYGLIITILISLSLIKVLNIIFNYSAFREFVNTILSNSSKKLWLDLLVLIFSVSLIIMGIYLY